MQQQAVKPFNQKIRLYTLRAGLLLLVPLLFIAQPVYSEEGILIEIFEVLGMFLLIAGVLGRLWATLYVGSRKNLQVVTDGPYSMTRNPLYFFSTIGTLGVGLMFGMLTLALALTLVVGVILWLTARREQAFLEAEFGPDYHAYAARVPMFLPDPRLFHTAKVIEVTPKTLRRNLRDALVFLLAFPILELSEILRERIDIPHIFLF